MFRNKIFTYLLFMLASSFGVEAQTAKRVQEFPFKHTWVDSVYNSLSLEQKFGQLFMVAAYSGGEKMNQSWIEDQILKNNIGGLIFMQGTAEAQAHLTNHYQSISKVPLLIGMDAEWGLGMRLTGVKDLPKQMTIGAANDTALMYDIGVAIAQQCKRLGVHINFAPTIDINNNPNNPVIGFRSFGANKDLVSTLGITYTKALQDNNIIACAKHFPGHGDVTVDSHEDLPEIKKDKKTLMDMELYPFKKLIGAGVKSIMIAHLNLPNLDTTKIPSTLSYPIVTQLLKEELQFDGLIITDALNMKGVTNQFPNGIIELKAFLAGNDVLLFSQDVHVGLKNFIEAYNNKTITEERLAYSVKKILGAKFDMQLHQYQLIDSTNATKDLNKAYNNLMDRTAIASMTLWKGSQQAFQKFTKAAQKVIITFNSNVEYINTYKAQFPKAKIINVDTKTTNDQIIKYISTIGTNSDVIIALHQLSRYPGTNNNYGYSDLQIRLLKQLGRRPESKFVVFGVPYMAQHFCTANNIVVAYEDQPAFLTKFLNFMHQDMPLTGKRPVEVCP